MSQKAQSLKNEAQEQVRQIFKRVRRLSTQLERQLNEHFGDEIKDLKGTRDRVLRQVGETSSRVTGRLLQDDVKLPQPLRAVLEQVSDALERWNEPAPHAAAQAHRAARPAPSEHKEASSETPKPRSNNSRPRRRRKSAAIGRNEEVTVPDGGVDAVLPAAPRPKRP